MRIGNLALWIVVSLLCACGSRHVRLVHPDTTPGSRYTCTKDSDCHPAEHDVPAEHNASGTTFVRLPRQCAGRIHQIVVHESGSSDPQVDVTCAPYEEPPGQPISEME